MSYYHSAGGPGGGSTFGTLARLLGRIIWLFLLYLGVGMAWRYSQAGARGLDVVPHLEFWRGLPAACRELAQSGVAEARAMMDPHAGNVAAPLEEPSSASTPLLRRSA